MRNARVARAMVLTVPFVAACSVFDDDLDGPSHRVVGSPSSSSSGSTATPPPLPTEFHCSLSGRTKLAVEAVPPDAALTIEAGVPPAITGMQPAAPIWGTPAVISGAGLGNGDEGEYVTFGSGEHQTRLDACPPSTSSTPYDGTCAAFSSSSSAVSFIVPLGATGDVVLHTKRGDATAGAVGATWRSSAVHRAPVRPRVLASLGTSDATYALVVEDVQNGAGTRTPAVPLLLRFTDTAVSSMKLDALGTVSAYDTAAFAERAGGGVDLGVAVTAANEPSPRLRFVHVMPNGIDVELEDACVPSSLRPFVMRRGATGTVAWAYLVGTESGQRAGIARLVYAADRRTWTIDRGPMSGPRTGAGIERDDGSVLVGWAEEKGVFLDAKAQARFARLAPGEASFRVEDLHEVVDDYVQLNVLATSAGFVVAHCSSDSTGFFDDTGTHGSHCHAAQIDGAGARVPLPGYPETFDASSTLGVVADRVVALRRGPTLGYHESPSDPASVIAGPTVTGTFVSSGAGTSVEPTVMLTAPGALAVATRPR